MRYKYLIILSFYAFTNNHVVETLPAAASRSGPFVSSITKVSECKVRTLPLDTNPSVVFYAELYTAPNRPETKLIRGNVTVLRDCKNKKIKVKGLYWEQNNWKLIYLMNNMGCNSVFMPLVTTMTAVRYDKKNCIFYKGSYTFDGVDTNKSQHILSSVQEYGRIMWRNEFFSQAGSVFCWEFETLVEPIKS